ncbi:aminopeptidase [Neobacillus sp. MER 74]|uniref:aminopeptidase n=1 Tax=Neobacillus sp. MER 74 TaxID=2939566 RepID=UPI0020409C8A|nr:aminopeptidase [Neobacillus sp. MER 74]MCM3116956.1 aminopeptidase [Neobacillus sp. MER 74]
MRTFHEKLEKYAALAVEIGANVQKGQILFISASIESYEFVKLITKRAYEIGASEVIYEWNDDTLTRMKYESASDEVFTDFPTYRVMQREELAAKNAAFIFIDSRNPDLLNGIDPERISNFNKASGTALAKFRTYMLSDKFAWTIVAYPNQDWADKVFPNIDEAERINALWDAIFSATRIDDEDTIGAWKEHIAALDSKANYLNGRKYKSLHYRAPGTDLTIELSEKHKWVSAGNHNEKGTLFIANIPTEEVFTSPNKYGVNGFVASTKPLSYSGNLIENFTLTFKEGKIVDFTCENGYETLKQLIETDDGSRYLGEIALVPHQSPISNSNTIFYNTLFDENASNHLAIGEGFPFCLDEGKTMSKEELATIGLNESMTHVDFMIGSCDMDIDGMLPDGRIEPIFRNGNWAF